MALLALAIPILPGKTEQWKRFLAELRGPRFADYAASRQRFGVRERAFLNSTPLGDIVVVTLDGDDPTGAFQRFGSTDDPFTRWFVQQVKEIHGVDLTQPLPGPMPELAIDSQSGGTHLGGFGPR